MASKNEQKVIAAARDIFLRYGFKRVTMAEIARAAHMSRPALYLVFQSKEEILSAVVTHGFAEQLAELRPGLEGFATVEEKLIYAFELWCVRVFELMKTAPDASDLYESTYQVAAEAANKANDEFVEILASLLEPVVRAQTKIQFSALEIAALLAGAVPGFKARAQTAAELRTEIGKLLTITLASLESPIEGK